MPDHRRIDPDEDEPRPYRLIPIRCSWCLTTMTSATNTLCDACLDKLEHEREYARRIS